MNKKMKIALTLIAVILVAALAISLAYSRYFTEVKGEGTATVAKWHFTVDGKTDTFGPISLVDTVSSNNKVASGKIAPGTSGSFNVQLDATGTEVELDYAIKLTNLQGQFPTNLKFYKDPSYTQEVMDIYDEGLIGTIRLEDSKMQTVTVYWTWPYQTTDGINNVTENDKIDTNEASKDDQDLKITFDVVVTGTQAQNV